MEIMSSSAVAPVATGDTLDAPGGASTAARPRLYREILLIALCYSAYSLVRNLVPTTHTRAIAFGHQRSCTWSTPSTWTSSSRSTACSPMSAGSASAPTTTTPTPHFTVTIAVLVWLYIGTPTATSSTGGWSSRRRCWPSSGLRTPLAPPRMLPGFVYTAPTFHSGGLYESGASPIASVSNQYAAMPSLHTGWALWCAIAICDVTRSRWVRGIAICYPLATVVVILGTANHYVLDAIGGIVTLGCGYVATRGVRLTIPRLGPAAKVFSRDPRTASVAVLVPASVLVVLAALPLLDRLTPYGRVRRGPVRRPLRRERHEG